MAAPILVNGVTGVLATPIFVAGPCKLYDYDIYNSAAAASFVSFYDTLLAPTVGTTVPKWQVGLATLTTKTLGAQDVAGIFFRDGLWIAATTTQGGNTAPGAALVISVGIGN